MKWRNVGTDKVHRLFYPQVPVIVTVQFENRIGGMPAIWCMPLSFNPSLVGVAIAPEHETHKMIIGAKRFGINWVDHTFADKVGLLGEVSAKEYKNKLGAVGFTTKDGEVTSQPLIEQASAALECELREKYQTGTHNLLVGKVVGAYAIDYFTDYWDWSKYNPLLYAGTTDGTRKSWLFFSGRGESTKVPLTHQT